MKNIFIITLIFSCFLIKAQNPLVFGAKQLYFLSANEKQANRDSNALLLYKPFNNDLQHQIPLNLFIVATNYKLFIGLALNDSTNQIYSILTQKQSTRIIGKKDTIVNKVQFYEMFCYDNNYYNLKIIFKTKKTYYTAVLNYISTDSATIAEFYYDKNFILSKFGKKIK